MEVDPVYVVEVQTRSRASSRVALLALGVAFAIGGVLGSTGGFVAARAIADSESTEGDPNLMRLQRLAVEAPIDELLDHSWEFLGSLGNYSHQVGTLWKGFERIAARVTEPSADARSQELARFATAVLSKSGDESMPARMRAVNLLKTVR